MRTRDSVGDASGTAAKTYRGPAPPRPAVSHPRGEPVLDEQVEVLAHRVVVQVHPLSQLPHAHRLTGLAQGLQHRNPADGGEDAVRADVEHGRRSILRSGRRVRRTPTVSVRPRRHMVGPGPADFDRQSDQLQLFFHPGLCVNWATRKHRLEVDDDDERRRRPQHGDDGHLRR